MNKEKATKILEVLKLWYLSTLVYFLIYGGLFYFTSKHTYFTESINYYSLIGTYIFSPLIFLLITIPYLPTIYIIKKIFTKFETTENNPIIKLSAISLLFPLTTLTYNIIEFLVVYFGCDTYYGVALIINFLTLLFSIPILFIYYLIIPKNKCQHKWENMLIIFVTSIIFILSSIFEIFIITNQIDIIITKRPFIEYTQTIEQIKDYHNKNKVYPEKIEAIHFKKIKSYTYYEYKTYNKNSEFILTVDKDKISDKNGYRLCSNENLPNCSQKTMPKGYTAKNYYKWIKTEKDID